MIMGALITLLAIFVARHAGLEHLSRSGKHVEPT